MGGPWWRSARVALLVGAALAVGCRASPDPTAGSERPLSREEFVEIVVELREAERAALNEDSAAARFAERKSEILSRHGVTETELRSFIEQSGNDVHRLQDLWDTVAQRLKHVPGGSEEGEAGAGPPLDPPDVREQRLH